MGLKARIGYRKPRQTGGKVHIVPLNRLQQQFSMPAPNKAWVADIIYVKTREGWLYLGVVVDLFSRRAVGWSMPSRINHQRAGA